MLAISETAVVTIAVNLVVTVPATIAAVAAVRASRQTRSDGGSSADLAKATHDLLRAHLDTPLPWAHRQRPHDLNKKGDAS